jgi:hypothetical protein
LRNVYEKVGAFGFTGLRLNDFDPRPDQIRGYGVEHDGSIGDISTFLFFAGFVFPDGIAQKQAVMDFVLGYPSNLAPIVGQQVTRSASSDAAVDQRIDLLVGQARSEWIVKGNHGPMACDLIVDGVVEGERRGWVFDLASELFESDRQGEAPLTDAELRALAATPGQELTYTCVPPGSGPRMGVDRDGDGARDRDEVASFTNPRSAGSLVGACNDGVDNDGDGVADFPADPDCLSAEGGSELAAPDVSIDVSPHSRLNLIRPHRRRVSVAVLGSSEVDVAMIDPATLKLGPDAASPLLPGRIRDGNHDGYPDLWNAYDVEETGLPHGRSNACLAGQIAGSPFESCDWVRRIRPPPVCESKDLRSWLRCRFPRFFR